MVGAQNKLTVFTPDRFGQIPDLETFLYDDDIRARTCGRRALSDTSLCPSEMHFSNIFLSWSIFFDIMVHIWEEVRLR